MKLSPKLQGELDRAILDSLKRGRGVRRRGVLWPALILLALLIILGASDTRDALLVAATFAASSLCVIWAIMSMSASLNAQCDGLATLVAWLAERDAAREERHD